MKNHEDLDVWKRAVELAASVYTVTRRFSEEEKFGLVSQMRRAAVSIASNIAEGAARQGNREFLHFLSIAAGSASELATQFVIAEKTGCCNPQESREIEKELKCISMMLQGLIKSIRSKTV